MQKRHLRTILQLCLAVFLIGCGTGSDRPENPYLHNNKSLSIAALSEREPSAHWGDIAVSFWAAQNASHRAIETSLGNALTAVCSFAEGDIAGPGPNPEFRRSLESVSRISGHGETEITAVPLPGGRGIAIYLFDTDDFKFEQFECGFYRGTDIDWRRPPVPRFDPNWTEFAEGILVWPNAEARNVALGFAPPQQGFTGDLCIAGRPPFSASLSPSSTQQVIIATGETHQQSTALVERYRGWSPEKLSAAFRDSLAANLAFQLETSDDRANQLFALMSASLAGGHHSGEPYLTRHLEEMAQTAVADFLLEGRVPTMVRPGADRDRDARLSRFTEDERILWSVPACRAILQYGGLEDQDVTEFETEVLAALSRYEAASAEDVDFAGLESHSDSLMARALGLIHRSDLMSLGEEISSLRGQNDAAGLFREKSHRASRLGRRYFSESIREYNLFHEGIQSARARLIEQQQDTTEQSREGLSTPLSTPDTAAWIERGAKSGFGRLGEDAEKLFRRVSFPSAHSWQKWVAHRFRNEIMLVETSNYDSLENAILSGPVPGMLSDESDGAPVVSRAGTAAALQNLAEIYLGVRPSWTSHRIELAPRLPSRWGRTRARVPIGSGALLIDYDFLHEQAIIGIERIDQEQSVVFHYPMPSGRPMTTQFVLGPRRPKVRVFLQRETGNRIRLQVKETS